jgi:hypothetical protein
VDALLLRAAKQIGKEWRGNRGATFSYQTEANGKIGTGHGKVGRVMRRQRDGSWKFAWVMGLPETNAFAAPVSEPCG